jgi:hypothetical protein
VLLTGTTVWRCVDSPFQHGLFAGELAYFHLDVIPTTRNRFLCPLWIVAALCVISVNHTHPNGVFPLAGVGGSITADLQPRLAKDILFV